MTEEAVVAAGAVVLHDGAVLMVHRPKYDDWSFPKGKQEPGEPEVVSAIRETLEETGLEIHLGRPLPSQTYVQRDGKTKVVHYWRGEVVGDADVSSYVANAEVDAVAWVPLSRAPHQLSYDRDTMILGEALRHRRPTTPLVLLRHAKAVGRKAWDGPDQLRPLTEEGVEQTHDAAALLAAYGVTRVVTSSSTRCADTVRPYAEQHGLHVELSDVLTEEHPTNPDDACALLARLVRDRQPTVVCTHRPLLPALLRHLGVDLPPMSPGDLVVVHHRKGRIRAAELHEVP